MPSMDSAYAFFGACSLGERDRVADADLTVVQDVRVQPGAVNEGLDRSGLSHRLEVGARFAELDALAYDLADPEPLAHELVDVDAACEDVAARRRRLDRDVSLARDCVHRLDRDERHRPARRRVSA